MTTRHAESADILLGHQNIALGENWFPLETMRGQSFRWVENDAVLLLAALVPAQHVLRLVLEPGPGAGQKPLTIGARLDDGTE